MGTREHVVPRVPLQTAVDGVASKGRRYCHGELPTATWTFNQVLQMLGRVASLRGGGAQLSVTREYAGHELTIRGRVDEPPHRSAELTTPRGRWAGRGGVSRALENPGHLSAHGYWSSPIHRWAMSSREGVGLYRHER